MPNPDEVILKACNSIRDAIRPDITLFTNCYIDEMEGKQVVVVQVQRGTARPYYLASKGLRPEGIFVRQGPSTVPATEAAILKMIRETSGYNYEEARSLNQSLTFRKTNDYFKANGLEFNASQKRSLHLIGDDGTYTNLALLLSDQCTHTVKTAVFEGSTKTVFRDRRELSGSLLDQLEESYAFIDRINRTRAEFSGLSRIDKRDYPPEAIRETLLNAIVHRDYSFSGPTLISIFDDRIEFVTIGGLVKGISLDDIMLGVSVLRNQHLAHVFYRLKLIEAYGTGMLKIHESYGTYSVKPQVDTSSNAFKIILPNVNFRGDNEKNSLDPTPHPQFFVPEEDREKAVSRLFSAKKHIVRKDVEQALGVSQATAIKVLRKMVEDGALMKSGGGKYNRYTQGKKKDRR